MDSWLKELKEEDLESRGSWSFRFNTSDQKTNRFLIIAAGGIADGAGMAAAFAVGAEGIQMGTRFVSSKEKSSS